MQCFFATPEEWKLNTTFAVLGKTHCELSLDEWRRAGMMISRRPWRRASSE
jgi:hypothetical protein